MNKLQQRTSRMVRDFIVDALKEFGQEDNFADNVWGRCDRAGEIDMTHVDAGLLMEDPKVKAAFKKFVGSCVGAFQYMEDEFGHTTRSAGDGSEG